MKISKNNFNYQKLFQELYLFKSHYINEKEINEGLICHGTMSSMLWLKQNWLSNHGSIDRALAPEEKGLQGFDCQVKVNL